MMDLNLTSVDASSVSVLWYKKLKPQGKVRRRVQDLRIPCSSYYDYLTSRTTLDLSHNESARLAADSLLSRGLEGYHEVLNTEGEVDFMSELEKTYILENRRDGSTCYDPGASENGDEELGSAFADCQSATRSVSTDSNPTVAGVDLNSLKDVRRTKHALDEDNIQVHFQSDCRAAAMKDLVRGFIRKATMALAIVMDSFSDVELLCDLLEASRKRNVSVHLLLDHLNLSVFVGMWEELKLDSRKFPKLSVRSVNGQTYCAKTGRKLTGQIAESFIITDWTEVLTGSFSFSWLSWQVHRSLVVLAKGSAAIPFHQEFHRLHSSSKPVPCFVAFITVPHTLDLYTTLHAEQNDKADVSKLKSSQTKTLYHTDWNVDAQSTQTKARIPVLSRPQSPELGHCEDNAQPPHAAGTGAQMAEKPLELKSKPQAAWQSAPANVEHVERNQRQIQSHSNPLCQNHVSYVQSQLTTTAENILRLPESNPLHGTVCYQSPLKTHSDLEHLNVGAQGLFFQQRGRDSLIKPVGADVGQNSRRRQWNCSLNVKPNSDYLSDHQVQPPFPSQQQEAQTSVLFPLTHPRGGLQTRVSLLETRRQDQPQRHHQPPFQSHPNTEAPGSAPTPGETQFTPFKLQSDSKLFSPGTATRLQPQPPPRLNWMHQSPATRPRPVTRHSSLSTTYGTGQQAGWRPFQSSMNTLLGRSNSMNERHSAGFK